MNKQFAGRVHLLGLIYPILTAAQWGAHFYLHFTDGPVRLKRPYVTTPRSHNALSLNLQLLPRSLYSCCCCCFFSTNAFPPLSPAVGFSQLSHGSISPLGGPAFPSLPTLCPEPRSLQLYSRIWHEPDLAHQTLAFKLVSCMI